ncbi:MAG: hypothetical protein HY812_02755 [Planctomycetes bacterium]|nr:hypothetical protein [Planctomycetota bacterium]
MRVHHDIALCCAALLLVFLTGCGSTRRVGKDLAVVATAPATILLGGLHEGLDWGDEACEPVAPLMLSPLLIPLHMVKHAVYTAVHALDVVWAPFYLLAAIDPQNDLAPLEIYSLRDGFPWKSKPFPVFEEPVLAEE